MISFEKLNGLIVAPHTPFAQDGSLALGSIEIQAKHFLKNQISAVFINGTTGEYSSLSTEERELCAERWMEVTKGTPLKVIVHVGSNAVNEARRLAKHAAKIEAHAFSALTPSYFKPATAKDLCAVVKSISSAAPKLPFYYYEIPSMTGLNLAPSTLLELAAHEVPNLRGIKFTSNNLVELQNCLHFEDGKYDIAFGFDEMLLAGLTLGCRSAVGSSYNFAAPLYHEIIQAFEKHDWNAARKKQWQSVQLIQALAKHGYMAAAKYLMTRLGIPVGEPRLPMSPFKAEHRSQIDRIAAELQA